MEARPEGRFCERCQTSVLDLTRVTRATAIAIARDKGGRVCARVRADETGVAVFAPEPVRRGVVPLALASLLVACSADEATDDGAVPPSATEVDGSPLAPPVLGLGAPATGSFGGSLATGVMMPIGREPLAPAAPVAVAVTPPEPADEPCPVPTAEQIALTRRKHQRRHPHVRPPVQPMMGMMLLDD